VASLVLRFGADEWVIDQINREATRTLMTTSLSDINAAAAAAAAASDSVVGSASRLQIVSV